ncbi:MAG: hypothetical protein MUE37_04510 [Bacteroidales bacterium]|jgi:hypothetical protein|nr:hypothetical protein [Bacteroidales bacterium]
MSVIIQHRIPTLLIALVVTGQFIGTSLKAQDSIPLAAAPVTSGDREKSSIHSFYAGTGYGSNLLYLGTTMSQDHGFGFASASYGLADKLYLSATGYTISNFSPFTAFYSLGLSFSHTFNSWFDISTSISRYNVAATLRDTLFSNFSYADATLGFDWRILYSKVAAGGLFAGEGQFYLQTRHSRYFETPSFARDKAFFSFDPYINILFGTVVSIETTSGVTETTVSPGYRPWKNNGRWQGPSTVTRYSESFGLMEIDFGVPVAFSYDFFTLEVEPGYVIPLYSSEGTSGTKGFLLLATLFFRIF